MIKDYANMNLVRLLEIIVASFLLGFFISIAVFSKKITNKEQVEETKQEVLYKVKIIEKYINVRKYPNISSENFGKAKYGETYKVLATFTDGDYTWYKIIYEDKECWIASGIIKSWVEKVG